VEATDQLQAVAVSQQPFRDQQTRPPDDDRDNRLFDIRSDLDLITVPAQSMGIELL